MNACLWKSINASKRLYSWQKDRRTVTDVGLIIINQGIVAQHAVHLIPCLYHMIIHVWTNQSLGNGAYNNFTMSDFGTPSKG